MTIDAAKKFFSELNTPYVLAFQRLVVDIQEEEWDYVEDIKNPVLQRLAATVCVLTDKVVHIVSKIAMTVESAVKTIWIAYLELTYQEGMFYYKDSITIKPIIEMGYRCPLSALVSAAYIIALPVTIPYGLAQAWYDPKAYANAQQESPLINH